MAKKRDMKRRQFLLGSLAGTGMFAMGGLTPWMRLANAETPDGQKLGEDRYYIFCYFGGGWDILLGLDPRDPTVFTADKTDETRILPAYELLDPAPESPIIQTSYGMLGAFMGDMATKHADKLAIIRGINMETLGHHQGQKRFLTGKPPSGTQARGSSAATWLASKFGQENIIPNLVSGSQTFNADQPTFAHGIKVAGVPDLLRAVRPSAPYLEPAIDQQLDALLAQAAQCPGSDKSKFHQVSEQSRLKSIEMVAGGLDNNFDFLATTDQMAALRDHYQLTGNNLNTGAARAAMAARAIINGVSRCVSISVAGGLDTHTNWAADQGPRQMGGFNAIARMLEDLEAHEYKGTGSTWADHTTIVAFSEFSRTPMLNARGGRDHWLNGASMLVGPDIKGGVIAGASSNVGMQPLPMNLETGAVDMDEGDTPNPEHIMQTLFHAVGITDDPADLRCDPIKAIMKA